MKNYTITILGKETIVISKTKKLEIVNGEIGHAIKIIESPILTRYIPLINITSMVIEDLDKKSDMAKKQQKHIDKLKGKK
jgi:hypothetical protein